MSQSTWEDHKVLQQTYPDLNLEDNVTLNGGGIVSHSVKVGANEVDQKNYDEGYVTVNPLHQGIRRSSRAKISNTRLSGYELA